MEHLIVFAACLVGGTVIWFLIGGLGCILSALPPRVKVTRDRGPSRPGPRD